VKESVENLVHHPQMTFFAGETDASRPRGSGSSRPISKPSSAGRRARLPVARSGMPSGSVITCTSTSELARTVCGGWPAEHHGHLAEDGARSVDTRERHPVALDSHRT